MQSAGRREEQTMEEILASIRKIISDDPPEAGPVKVKSETPAAGAAEGPSQSSLSDGKTVGDGGRATSLETSGKATPGGVASGGRSGFDDLSDILEPALGPDDAAMRTSGSVAEVVPGAASPEVGTVPPVQERAKAVDHSWPFEGTAPGPSESVADVANKDADGSAGRAKQTTSPVDEAVAADQRARDVKELLARIDKEPATDSVSAVTESDGAAGTPEKSAKGKSAGDTLAGRLGRLEQDGVAEPTSSVAGGEVSSKLADTVPGSAEHDILAAAAAAARAVVPKDDAKSRFGGLNEIADDDLDASREDAKIGDASVIGTPADSAAAALDVRSDANTGEAMVPVSTSTEPDSVSIADRDIAEALKSEIMGKKSPVNPEPMPSTVPEKRSLEDIVSEMLEPMLRDWIEQNMPEMVEKALQKTLAERAKRAKLS